MCRYASVLCPVFVFEAGDGEEHKSVVATTMMLNDADGINALADESLPREDPA